MSNFKYCSLTNRNMTRGYNRKVITEQLANLHCSLDKIEPEIQNISMAIWQAHGEVYLEV